MKVDLKKIFILTILFYIIYTPTTSSNIIFDKNITIPILTFALLCVYLFSKRNEKILIDKKNVFFVFGIFLSIVYCFIVYCMKNESFNLIDSRVIQNLLAIFYLFDVYYIYNYFQKKGKEEKLFEAVINFGVLQGVISLLMVLIPNLHNIALLFYSKGGNLNHFIASSRIYGISSDYTYATPIFHGFLAAILFRNYLKGNKKDLLKAIIILIVVVLNGRTGLLIFVLCSLIYLFFYLVQSGKIFKSLKTILLLSFVLITTMFGLYKFVPSTFNFVTSFFSDTIALLQDNELSGNYAILEKDLHFPNGIDLITGKGFRVYAQEGTSRGYESSDIGYVNDIYFGGLIYSSILYISYVYFISKKIQDKEIKFCLLLTLILANFKGEAFHSTVLLFLIYLLSYNFSGKNIKKEKGLLR